MKRPRLHLRSESAVPGFQIAPMVDVVFVIMLFFMAAAWLHKKESWLSMKLPGGALDASVQIEFPDELVISVDDDGSVSLNDEPYADGTDRRLSRLGVVLSRLQELKTSHAAPLATLEVAPEASYERMVEVLGALSRAGIDHVTLRVNSAA